jgi:hypothetical protein
MDRLLRASSRPWALEQEVAQLEAEARTCADPDERAAIRDELRAVQHAVKDRTYQSLIKISK